MSGYSRVFITLKEDRTGYGLASRQPVGRCVVEARGESGKITFTVQDLKPGVVYEAFLMRANPAEAEGIPLGLIHVDNKGKGELKCNVTANNVLNSQIPVSGLNIAAVFVAGDKDLITPLVGFKDETIRWRQNFRTYKQPTQPPPAPAPEPVIPEPTPPEPVIPEPAPQAPTQPEPTPQAPIQEEPPAGAYNQLVQNFKEELEELEYFAFTASAEKETGDLAVVFGSNIKMVPFKHQDTPTEWVRITIKELNLLPFHNIWEYVNHPLLTSSYEEYHHLILGRHKENDAFRYTLGVPGIYDSKYQPKASKNGFQNFKSCDCLQPVDGVYGYWLLDVAE